MASDWLLEHTDMPLSVLSFASAGPYLALKCTLTEKILKTHTCTHTQWCVPHSELLLNVKNLSEFKKNKQMTIFQSLVFTILLKGVCVIGV